MNLLRVLLLGLLPLTAIAEDSPLPNPPVGHVLDRSGWLARPDTIRLENELSRLRTEHQTDVIVVIWDRPLPIGLDLDAFARRLGQPWAREDLWSIVLQRPGTASQPAIACGGSVLDRLPQDSVQEAIQTATGRGMKEWTDPARVRGVALNLAEELVYLRLRRQYEQASIKKAADDALATAQRNKNSLMIRIALGILAALLVAGVLIATRMLLRRRGPSQLAFPETRWRRRLGAPWSGGSDLVTTFTPPDPR